MQFKHESNFKNKPTKIKKDFKTLTYHKNFNFIQGKVDADMDYKQLQNVFNMSIDLRQIICTP